MGVLETLLGKTERRLKEMLYRFSGVRLEENLHILELMLMTYTLRLSYRGISCFEYYKQKLNFVLSRVDHLHIEESLELSHFVNELQNISSEVQNSEDGSIHKLYLLLPKPLNLFSLKHFVLSGELKYPDGEVVVCDNDFQNPIPFISGLPVGIPFRIKLYNISNETRLWLTMTLGVKSTQTPKVKNFSLMVSIAMECLSEDQQHFTHRHLVSSWLKNASGMLQMSLSHGKDDELFCKAAS
ncbi:hypothetical protein BUALT_Bualt09G0131100 [Buddleja alternifolia]|uniref:Uncharacterized protein n=1 Tax=Buddleja alternifolia TaxID=168488 RepID=A0AAV6X3X1_9LAMI|nr:hypothetical protein BUALT_Bualt09G0131100 [Buddleja alternifolia]